MQDLSKTFQLQDGSVVGRTHVGRGNVLTGRNSQDAFCHYRDDRCIVMVVSDGCGSTPYAEFGARLIANLVCREFRFMGRADCCTEARLADAMVVITSSLRDIEAGMIRDFETAVQFAHDHFLATVVACIVTPTTTTVVSCGDGCFALNGEFCSLDDFESRPPYLAYSLMGYSDDAVAPESFRFSVVAQKPTSEVQSLMVGTDGVEDLRAAALKFLPGTDRKVGPLSQFWTDDRYFANPVAIDRVLHRANSEHKRFNAGLGRIETSQGLLPDDTTMLVMRRRPPTEDSDGRQ